MTTLIKQKKSAASNLSTEQKTFNRLRKKVEKLHLQIQRSYEDLDESFKFYYKTLLPAKQIALVHLADCTKLMYGHYKNLSTLSKKDKKILKEILSSKISEILSAKEPKDADPEICAMLKDLDGVDFHKEISSQFDEFKKDMESMFRDEGVDVDLSGINDYEDQDDLKSKMFEAMREARERMEENGSTSQTKQKTKKELDKEKKIQELENLQKKGLSTIYKQLAKAIHPDLEQDPEKKGVKETLMKRLTNAYDTNDLHALLTLEIEWMNQSQNDEKKNTIQGNEQLKTYNSILKTQVESLEQELAMAFMHPKYLPIHEYLSDNLVPIFQMERELTIAQMEATEYQDITKKLLSKDPLKTLRFVCSEYLKEIELLNDIFF